MIRKGGISDLEQGFDKFRKVNAAIIASTLAGTAESGLDKRG